MSRRSTSFAFDLTTTADGVIARGNRTAETGRLQSLSIIRVSGATLKGQLFVRSFTRLGGKNPENASSPLVDDYVYEWHMAHWVGNLPLPESTEIVIEGWGSTASVLRIVGVIDIEDFT